MEYTANLYGLVKAASYQEEEEEKKNKGSWFSRHPILTALGLAGAGYGGYKYISSGEAAEDLAGIKNWIGESALGQSSFGKSLGLDKWVDFDHNRLDTSKFGPGHVPGSLPESVMKSISAKGGMATTAADITSQKTGMDSEAANKYIDAVTRARKAASPDNRAMGSDNVLPSDNILLYNDRDKLSGDIGADKKTLKDILKGPFSVPLHISGKGGYSTTDSVAYTPESGLDVPKGMKERIFNGLYNKNVKGDMDKLMSPAQILSHETSHATNVSSPIDGPGHRFKPMEGPNGRLVAGVTSNKSEETATMHKIMDAMLNNKGGTSDMTYPLYRYPEASQSLASMKQLAIALNGGVAPKSKAGWRKAFEHIAQEDPETLEQYRFQSYLTPSSGDTASAVEKRMSNVDKLMDILLREDIHGISPIDQLAFTA